MKKLFVLLLLSLVWNCGAAITTNKLMSSQAITNYVEGKFTAGLFSSNITTTNGNLYVAGVVSSTNGIILMASNSIPTNYVPNSTATVTNYLMFNWTNMGIVFVATNLGTAGSFIIQRPTFTATTWP